MARFKQHAHRPKADSPPACRFPFVCIHCRKSFKYPAQPERRICPQCRGPMERLSRKFSAPKSSDRMQWRKVQYLVEHGFRFHTAFVQVAPGVARSVDYPRTLREARDFVELMRAAANARTPSRRGDD